jgi:hypothetical protein
MQTTYRTSRGFTVEIEQIKGGGAPWIVRSYRKFGFLRRKLSSDWFLNEQQARTFAEQLTRDFEDRESPVEYIQTRKPGWTLHRPAR